MSRILAIALLVSILVGCGGGSPSASDYCRIAQQIEDAGARFNPFGGPNAVRSAIQEIRGLEERITPISPAAIAADVRLIRDSAQRADIELAKVDYRLERLSEEADAAINSDESQAASDRIDAYNKSSCPGFRPAPEGSASVGT